MTLTTIKELVSFFSGDCNWPLLIFSYYEQSCKVYVSPPPLFLTVDCGRNFKGETKCHTSDVVGGEERFSHTLASCSLTHNSFPPLFLGAHSVYLAAWV